MAARSVRLVLFGIVVVWSIVPGDSHSLAADDQPAEAEVQPLPEAESALGQPQESDCLGLLESSDELYICDDEYVGGDEGLCFDEGDYDCLGGFWIRADYLLFWTNGSRLPPLVTTSPQGTPEDQAGVLGQAGTTILFGNSRVNQGGRSNFRLTMGYWLDYCETLAWAADYYDSGQESAYYASGMSAGEPILARPFYDVFLVNDEWRQLVAYPGVVVGDVNVRASNYFESTGTWLRYNLCCLEQGCQPGYCECDGAAYRDTGACADTSCVDACYTRAFRLDVIGGYRYYRATDSVTVHEDLVSISSQVPVTVGTMFIVDDSFRATNEFNGGELGLVAQWFRGRWSLELLAKMALGNNHQVVIIDGSTAITVPGQPTANHVGGLLALQTNIGRHVRNDFVVIPQFGLELGYQLNDCLRLTVGYDFLYWANVVRAGDQIDRRVDTRNMPPPDPGATQYPAFAFNGSDFWAQAFTAGFELRF